MKLTDKWSIESGPHNQDFQLKYEERRYDEKKNKEITSTQTYYYPTFKAALDGFMRYSMIDYVDIEGVSDILSKLEELKKMFLEVNDLNNEGKDGSDV